MADQEQEDIQRWTTKRKVALVVSIIKGETSIQEVARQHGITVAEIEDWQERFLLGAENALRARPKDEEALKDEQIKKLKQKIGGHRHRHSEGGGQTPPSDAGDVGAVKQAHPGYSLRRICAVLHVSRSSLSRPERRARQRARAEPDLEQKVLVLIQEHPTYGYRRLWALLKRKRWLVHQRAVTPRPRVQGSISRTEKSDRRWAMDLTHVFCGRDGWAHLVGVIDCCDRELVGWEFALRGRAKEAERAIEEACIRRFGTLRPRGSAPTLRSDNGLIFQSRRFRSACRDYHLKQEYITPYTPEQNGIIERFFRSLKEECVWQNRFEDFTQAKRAIGQWIEWYNGGRPHQSLGYKSPREYRAQVLAPVA